MEGKEYYDNQDDDLNSGSKKDDSDSDSFGLPEYESTEGDSPDDKKNEDDANSYEDSYSSDSWEDDKKEETDDYGSDQGDSSETDDYGYASSEYDEPEELPPVETTESEYKSTYYEDEYQRKKSPVGWIILIVALLLAAAVAIFWLFNRDSKPKEVVREQIPVQPKVTTPIVEKEETPADELVVVPELKTENESLLSYEPGSEGDVLQISDRTNRYYVIVSSSIDDDLLMDYAKKLTGQGLTCTILAPRGNIKFHRLAVADYEALNDAALKSEELKADFGQGVWVIRY